MKQILLIILALSVELALAASPLKIAAGAAPLENLLKPAKDGFEKTNGIIIDLMKGTPASTLKMVEEGKAEIAVVGFDFADWLKLAEKEGFVPKANDFKTRTIGNDKSAIVVHQGVGVTKLTKNQLKSIFSGQAKNWKEFGGPDLKIEVIYSKEMPGLNSLIVEKINDKEPLKGTQVSEKESSALRQKFATTAGAVGWLPKGAADGHRDIGVVETEVFLGRPIVAATIGMPSPEALKLFEYLLARK